MPVINPKSTKREWVTEILVVTLRCRRVQNVEVLPVAWDSPLVGITSWPRGDCYIDLREVPDQTDKVKFIDYLHDQIRDHFIVEGYYA